MYQDEYEAYDVYRQQEAYQPQRQVSSAATTGLLERPRTLPEGQDSSQPPRTPAGPTPTTAPRKPHRGGAMVFLTLVLLVIFSVGLFSGWEFSRGNTVTTTQSTTTTSQTQAATSPSSANMVETQQEAAIATIEPSVVELVVTTAQGQQSGSGVIIDANGDIITNNHVVNGGQTIQAVLSNGATENAQLVGVVAADDLAVVRIAPFLHMVVAQIDDSSKL